MQKLSKEIFALAPMLLAIIIGAGIVYAAQSYRVNNGTASQVNEWGTCGNVTNNSGRDIFIPTNSSGEWSTFRGALPSGVSIGSCCAGNYGLGCSAGPNSCGQYNYGTFQCNGSCSVGAPGNPPGYGNSCNSADNSCGQHNTGTIQCDGSCSASQPDNSTCASCKRVYNCSDIYAQSGNNYCPGSECSFGNGVCSNNFNCANVGSQAACNPYVTCEWIP